MIALKTSTAAAWLQGNGRKPPAGSRARPAALALFAYEDGGLAGASVLEPGLRRQLLELAKAEAFAGKPGECVSVKARDGAADRTFLLAGVGRRAKASGEALRRAAGVLARFARKRHEALGVLVPAHAQAVGEGLLLASYRFEEYRKPEEGTRLAEAHLLGAGGSARALAQAADRAAAVSEAVCLARDLVNRGPSDKTPESLGKLAQSLAGRGVTVKLVGAQEAGRLGMGSYLSVARGSSVAPCFVHLRYAPRPGAPARGKSRRAVGLVGKGITFDSGGLSLKPPQAMETMKMDMAGAAAILGVFKALPRLGVRTEVQGFCAFTYNMPGPDATKPGDVVRAMNGKTIEILNTDAEGRLVLADALAYACGRGLAAVVDVATLTGGALIALGNRVAAAMATDKPLLRKLLAAAGRSGEAFWELPLVEEYRDNLKSSVADLRNVSKARGGEASTIIGGLFLREFVGGTPWAHLDIAGPAWSEGESDYGAPGGTGFCVRTLLEFLARY